MAQNWTNCKTIANFSFRRCAVYNLSKWRSFQSQSQALANYLHYDKDYGYLVAILSFSKNFPYFHLLFFSPGCQAEIPQWPSRRGRCQIVSRQSTAWMTFSNTTDNNSRKFFKQNRGKKSELTSMKAHTCTCTVKTRV